MDYMETIYLAFLEQQQSHTHSCFLFNLHITSC